MKPFYAYLLHCADDSYYAGSTDDLERRLAEHESGHLPGYTHTRRPVRLVWSAAFPTRDEAFAMEHRVKGWSRAKKAALVVEDWARLQALSVRGGLHRRA